MGYVILVTCTLPLIVQPTYGKRSIAHVQELLSYVHFRDCAPSLISAAPRDIELYDQILNTPTDDIRNFVGLYSVIAHSQVDRKRFLPSALRHLTHDDARVRASACSFIANVGTAADSGPLLILLSDYSSDSMPAYTAARALSDIGDDRTVIALDVWLKFARKSDGDPNHPTSLVRYVTQHRNILKARLAAEKAKALPAKNTDKPK